MKITYRRHLTLSEFERAQLAKRFKDLISGGELRSGNSEEFTLDHNGELYILAPNLVFDEDEGETVCDGYILMREVDFI